MVVKKQGSSVGGSTLFNIAKRYALKILTVTQSKLNKHRAHEFKLKFPQRDLTLLLVTNEVSAAHGTGILAYRMLKDIDNVAVLRSHTHYDGSCLLDVPDVVLPAEVSTRHDLFQWVADTFHQNQIRRVVCIPWESQELILAIALKRIFKFPLVLYLMDDNCIYTGKIPRDLLAEAIGAADLVFVISPEMQNAYQNEFRHKMWILPPLLDSSTLLPTKFKPVTSLDPTHGLVVGNIWHQSSLDLFCSVLKESTVTVDWYCNTDSPSWLRFDKAELQASGIQLRSPIPEFELAKILRRTAFAILPSSELVSCDPTQNISRLSLPSRVPFLAACGGTPIVVLGSERTSAGAFVKHFGLGAISKYDPKALDAAIRKVTNPRFRLHVTKWAKKVGRKFSSAGNAKWIEQSSAAGRAADNRFEDLLSYRRKEFGYYIPAPAPKDIVPDFRPAYESLERLKSQGFSPEFVLDVGASTGVWSATIARLFPKARYFLVDPLFDRYPADEVKAHLELIKSAQIIPVAVSDRVGYNELIVSDNIYGSSLKGIGSGAIASERVRVSVTTLNEISKRYKLKRNGLVKIDVQFAEHLVLAGGVRFLTEAVDCIVLELTLERTHIGMKTLPEIVNQLARLGFSWVDMAGEWRSLDNGRLEQIDVVLIRKGSFYHDQAKNRKVH